MLSINGDIIVAIKGLRGDYSEKEAICGYINFLKTKRSGDIEFTENYSKFKSNDFKIVLQDYSKKIHSSSEDMINIQHCYSNKIIQCFVNAATIGISEGLKNSLLPSDCIIYGVIYGGIIGGALGSIVNLIAPKDYTRSIIGIATVFGAFGGAYFVFEAYGSYVEGDSFNRQMHECVEYIHSVELSGVLVSES